MLSGLSKYLKVNEEKRQLVDEVLAPPVMAEISDFCKESVCYSREYIPMTKYCPKCGSEFPDKDNFCHDCLCSLKEISEMADVRDIKSYADFPQIGYNLFTSFDEIFTPENSDKITEFSFNITDYNRIIKDIKRQAIENAESLLDENELNLKLFNTSDKVLLFAKAFAEVEYKSYGRELGNFTFDKITVDERLIPSLMVTTLIHELSHMILKEIISRILCKLLDCTKNSYIEAISVFILSFSPFTRLIDEYAAHTVEGRFTVYGYQDYSSFLVIEKSLDGEMPRDEIEITKSIGNTFANSIKDILESFIDEDLRADIRNQFLKYNRESPNYDMLRLENCKDLTAVGFKKAIWLVLSEGFAEASENIDKLIEYENALNS